MIHAIFRKSLLQVFAILGLLLLSTYSRDAGAAASEEVPAREIIQGMKGRRVECSLARSYDQVQNMGRIQIQFGLQEQPLVESIKMRQDQHGAVLNLEYEGEEATYQQASEWIVLREYNELLVMPKSIVMSPRVQKNAWPSSPHILQFEDSLSGGRYLQDLPDSKSNVDRRVEILQCSSAG